MRSRLYILILLHLLYFCGVSFGQINSDGTPFIRNYSPRTYSASEPNWAIAQDNRGVMYFGNSQCILEYDGQSWQKIPVSGQTYILSLASGADGTIYAGGIDDFGQLVVNPKGQLVYESLTSLLDKELNITRVWKIYSDSAFIYFCTLQYIFIYEPNSKVIEIVELPPDSFWSFFIDNRLYTGNYNIGLHYLENKELVKVKGGENFINKDIFSILKWSNDTLLIATAENGLSFFIINSGTVKPFNFNPAAVATNKVLHENSLYAGIQIDESNYAFATLVGGLFIINKNGQIATHLNEELGLQSETVSNLFYSPKRSGVLWLTLANGITSVNISSPIRHFAGVTGLNGALWGLTKHKGTYYAASMLGVFRLEHSSISGSTFKPIQGITGEIVYSLLNFVAPDGKEILIAGSVKDIYEIKGNTAYPLNINVETNRLVQSQINPNRVYVATSRGIRIIALENTRLSFSNQVFALNNESITKIIEDREGNLWCSSLSGLHLINSKGVTMDLPESIKGSNGSFFILNQDLFFASEGKIYIYSASNHDFTPFDPLNKLLINQKKQLREVFPLNDTLALVHFTLGNDILNDLITFKDNSWKSDTISMRIIPPMTVNTAYIDKQYIFAGGHDGLFIQNRTREKNYLQEFHSLIRTITIGSDSLVFMGGDGFLNRGIDEKSNVQIFHTPIDFRHNNIVFTYSASYFENEDELQYRSYLMGFDRDWSSWQNESSRNYTNLKEGTYFFHVKARNIYGVESKTTVFEFRILPPWFRTWWAYLMYIILAFVIIRISVALYTRKLQEDKRRLEAIVKERTAEIVEKNKRIEHQNIAITDSIRYAKRIQTAVLPDKQTSELFDYFIYFAPKDIVSGDFYWIHHFEKQKRLIAIAADCTGHGVPGAFMSMLGTSFLNEIVAKLDVNHSDSILNRLREYVINTLSQGVKDEEDKRKDGMDLALVSIDLTTMMLEFSGANNPLVLIRNNEIIEYKPDKMPIGAYVKQDEPFKRSEIKLQKDDTFYLFSDGFVDQFGGEDGRKYMKKNFKEFLLTIHHHPMAKQKELLIKEMEQWIEGYEQIDDQLVIGMKLVV
jgi:serine phosphatase RsbU (regulator of sigma subunit)